MNKFTAIQKTCGWPWVYKQITDQYGKETADVLFSNAEKINGEYLNQYGNCRGIKKTHVTAAIASGSLYLPLKEKVGSEKAIQMLMEAVKPFSEKKHNKIEKLPAGLFMRVAEMITTKMFSEEAGFQRKWHSNTDKEKRYDLLTCPYVEVLKTMGCPEACPAICIQDDISFSNLKNGVIFKRKKTLGRGDDCCDFCFCIPENRKA